MDSQRFGNGPLGPDSIAELERSIFAARDTVVPSQDLRPRVMESARDQERLDAVARRASFAALACMVVAAIAISTLQILSGYRDSMVGPTSQQIEQRAYETIPHGSTLPAWGLVDAFGEVRSLSNSVASPVEIQAE